MTGFATLKGEAQGWSWVWDMRAVNARGLDVRVRAPDWLDGLDQAVRAAVPKAVSRGSVTIGLRLSRGEAETTEEIDLDVLGRALAHMHTIEVAADRAGVELSEPSTLDVLALRGMLTADAAQDDGAALTKTLSADLPALIEAFNAMRATEGQALVEVVTAQLDRIAALTDQAAEIAEARKDQWAAKLKENLARVLENSEGADPARVAQELAIIAVKTDVTEEIDRLRAHVQAARDLLAAKEPVGRKLDFLSQEFNREANTLCSKSQSAELTPVGLDLKATIDQMREQIQNVE
ncbi:Protein YicC [Candidatus Rhodobacter oscarellae]|uniref:Protein YicC n=1 Tax=Candidatus Rhodobacter oscarellae TaxID=1675527 RepID=A0A0J9E3I8_9RHOB|nr:YicC/YloC family endoribonuclease [Candidatus Rhodobacter lobularis]KMW57262.1 Protein YicC [Candidatus Rhodobacter lobularis]